MADLTITATSVLKGTPSPTTSAQYVAGETITAGQPVYVKTVGATNTLFRCKCSGLPTESQCFGIALNGASINQPVNVLTAGQITIGATVVVATIYVVSTNYGGIAPWADLVSTNYLTIIGYADTTGTLVVNLNPTLVTK